MKRVMQSSLTYPESEKNQELQVKQSKKLSSNQSLGRQQTTARFSHVQIDIMSGITAGIMSNIVSHPLDTVKVRMQLNTGAPVKFG